MKRRATAVLWLAAGIAARGEHLGDADSEYATFANLEQFRLVHLDLALDVDLHNHELDGNAALEFRRLDPRATQLVLDTQGLNVLVVSELTADFVGAVEKPKPIWINRPFRIGRPDPKFGSRLIIDLSASKDTTEIIKIQYETTDKSAGLNWRVADPNDSKRRAFLYTRADPIGARSWVPLQDTPLAPLAYRIHIRTPDGLRAVMGSGSDPKAKRNGDYEFIATTPVPPEQMAFAVGEFGFKPTGVRTGIYAEKSLLSAAAKEFADTESLLSAAAAILGPYPLERFDLLVMPAHFPEVAIAHPGLSFVSPTLVAGDKSLMGPIAESVARAWAGAQTHSPLSRDRWLNDALAGYLRRRILAGAYGETAAVIQSALDEQAWRAARAACEGGDATDAACVRLAAQRGIRFFAWLEDKFGRERVDGFLRGYFGHFAAQTVTVDQFTGYLGDNLLDRNPGIVTREQAVAWIAGPDPADTGAGPAQAVFEPVDAARQAFELGKIPGAKLDARAWRAQQWIHFLDGLPNDTAPGRLAELDHAFSLTSSRNDEIERAWLLLAVRTHYRSPLPRLEEYLKSVGRADLIVPLYAELLHTPDGVQFVKRVYPAARPGYDRKTAASIEGLANFEPDSADQPSVVQ